MFQRFILFILSIFISLLGMSQSGSIEGYIYDADLKTPLQGASINIGPDKTDNTDLFGKFSIHALIPGQYTVSVSYVGYVSVAIPVIIKNNTSFKINVSLHKSSLNLSEVRINSKKASGLNTISTIDIKLRPINTSQDILRIVPGLFIAQHAGGGKAEQIFLRGYDIDHGTDINITVDGMPVNMVSHAHGQGYADMHFVIPETVEKVNFDKGPYFANKGNLATAGYVSLETKDFLQTNQIKVQAAQFNTQRVVGMFRLFNKESEQLREQFYIASEYFKSNGYFESPQHFHRFNLLGKYSAIFQNKTKWTVLASILDSKWNASGQIPERAVKDGTIGPFGSIDDSEGGNTTRFNFSAKLDKQMQNGWQMSHQLYYTKYKFNLYSNFTFFLNDPVNGDEIDQKENRSIVGYKGTFAKSFNTSRGKAFTEIGYGFRYDFVKNATLDHVVKRVFLAHKQLGDIHETNPYLYLNQDIELSSKLNLNTGLRYDYFVFGYKNILLNELLHQSGKGTISPKLNLNYNVNSKLKIYLNNGIGFHSNDSRLIIDGSAQNSLPKVFGTDLGAILKPNKNIVFKAALWHLYSQQEFVYVGDEGIVEPSGKTRRMGVDISARYQILSWLFADIDINYARPRAIGESKGNDYVPLAPNLTSVGGLSVKAKNGFNASLRYRAISDRPANEDNTVIADGYFLLDAVLSYIWKKFEFSLSGENLLNTYWKEAQFDTETRLKTELNPVSEIHYTPGTPRYIKAGISIFF